MEFKDVIAEIITGLKNGTFQAEAGEGDWAKGDEDFQEAVNVIAGILDGKVYSLWALLAAGTFIGEQSEHVRVNEIERYLEAHYRYSGATVGSALQEYASTLGNLFELGRLYDELDRAGGVDRFDWGSYADDGMTPTNNLHFIQVPAPAGEPGVYLFESGR